MRRYGAEERADAVAMVRRARSRPGALRGAIAHVAAEIGVHPVTLGGWVRQADFVDGTPNEHTTAHRRIVALEREVAELRRVNALLRAKERTRTASTIVAARGAGPS